MWGPVLAGPWSGRLRAAPTSTAKRQSQRRRRVVLVHQIDVVLADAGGAQLLREPRQAVGVERRSEEPHVARDDHVLGTDLADPRDLAGRRLQREAGRAELDECALGRRFLQL